MDYSEKLDLIDIDNGADICSSGPMFMAAKGNTMFSDNALNGGH